jgi:hypothetical protein
MPRHFESQAPRQMPAAPPRVSAAPQRPVQSAPSVQRSGGDRGNGNRRSEKSEDGSNSRR